MCHIDLKTLNSYYHWLLNSYQSMSMSLYDAQSIYNGKTIGYGIDGYDLCRYLFPASFFKGNPNPHHSIIHSIWSNFFQSSDGVTVFGVISPFAILELLATIQEKASGKQLNGLLGKSSNEIRSLLIELAEGIRTLEDVSPKQKQVIETLVHLAGMTDKARRILQEGKAFEQLNSLLSSGKLKLLDPIIGQSAARSELATLLVPDNTDYFSRALQYLGYRRESTFSDHSIFYNTLDIYHYVLFDNVDPIIRSKDLEMYLSSSGILSRNSWHLVKYGKLPDDLLGIPSDWAARSSDVPNFLVQAFTHFRNDLPQIQDFFEEGRVYTRKILRDLRNIPELSDCLTSAKERQRLLAQNPILKIRGSIPQAIREFQNDYYRFVVPEFKDVSNLSNDAPAELDLVSLYRWVMNPETRSKEYTLISEQVQRQLDALDLKPLDWKMYIAPLGDVAYDILSEFDPAIA